MYSRTCPATSVDDRREQLFGQGSSTIENISPQHVKRALYQAEHVWSSTLVSAPHLPSIKLWGMGLIQARNLSGLIAIVL